MPGSPPLAFRMLRTLDELRACVALQEETWGEGFSQRVPVSVLKVVVRLGGVVAGAFDEEDTLVGFVFGLTGLEAGRPVHWSDMLAVRAGHRDSGLGRRLKEFQRELVLERGVDRMYWTFDPIESRNAYLNITRLGAVVREYQADFYGVSDSLLHGSLPTDRLVALWELSSPRVCERLAGRGRLPGVADIANLPLVLGPQDASTEGDPTASGPGALDLSLEGPAVRVAIPAEAQRLRETTPEAYREWRFAARAALQTYLERGYQVSELVRSTRVSWYVLEKVQEGGDG